MYAGARQGVRLQGEDWYDSEVGSQGDGLDARIRVAAALGLFHATVASQEGIAAMSNCMVVRSATFDTAGCACERVGNAAPLSDRERKR
jgi:hypothetical protein